MPADRLALLKKIAEERTYLAREIWAANSEANEAYLQVRRDLSKFSDFELVDEPRKRGWPVHELLKVAKEPPTSG